MCQRFSREGELLWVIGVDILLPTKLLHHPGSDSVRLTGMPVVVEMKNCHVVPAYEFQLVLESGVVLDVVCVILVEVKGRLMSNNHVFARGSGPLHNIEGCHPGGGDSMNRCALVPGNDLVHGLCSPGNSHLLANPVNDLSRSQ